MATRTTSVPLWRHLYLQVLVAIALGHFAPDAAVALKPLGDLFVRLIRMVIAPAVFCAVVAGIASMRDMKAVGRAGGKALLHFELISSVALGFGLLMGHLLHPGAGFNVSVASLDASAVSGYVSRTAHGEGVAGFLMHAIPETFVGAFTHDEILPVLLIAMLCGSALSVLGERVRPVVEVVEGVAAMMSGSSASSRAWRRSARSMRPRSPSAGSAWARCCRCSSWCPASTRAPRCSCSSCSAWWRGSHARLAARHGK